MKKLLTAAAVLAMAAASHGAVVLFSTSNAASANTPTGGGVVSNVPTANPTINVTLNGSDPASPVAVPLYVIARKSSTVGGTYVNSLGLNIRGEVASGNGSIAASSFVVNNPSVTVQDDEGNDVTSFRWSGTANGELNSSGLLVNDSKAVAVGVGASSFYQPLSSATQYRLHGSLGLNVTPGTQPTVINLYFQVGSGVISESDTASTTSSFGFAAGGSSLDPSAVPNFTPGGESQTPDAVIIVPAVPEPASLGLLGLGGLALAARRRQA